MADKVIADLETSADTFFVRGVDILVDEINE